jgi:hypothetical protein
VYGIEGVVEEVVKDEDDTEEDEEEVEEVGDVELAVGEEVGSDRGEGKEKFISLPSEVGERMGEEGVINGV